MSSLCAIPAVELVRLFRRRELSPVEVLDAYLERIEEVDPALNAFVTVLDREARTRAEEAERAARSDAPLGPLHGVPVAIKDLFDFKAGAPHSFGFLDPSRWVPANDSLPVERLERAGAIVIGKTATPALGYKLLTDNPLRGPTSTPYAPGYNAGGSSGGSAAAVAAGMAAVALGSDAAGSLRVPAALCGVFSLKPTYGRVPSVWRPNAFRSLTPMTQVGPIARTVADAARVLEVIAGPHRADPLSLPPDQGIAVVDPIAVNTLSVAYSPDLGSFPISPAVGAAVETGLSALAAAGVHVEPVDLSFPHHGELFQVLSRLFGLGLLDAVSALEQEGIALNDGVAPPDEGLALLIERARTPKAVDIKADEACRTRLLDRLEDVLEIHDALLTPVTCVAGVPNADHGRTVGPSEVEGQALDPLLGWSLAYPFNLTGHPSASIPVGFSGALPVGMQIVGRRFDERTVMALARTIERTGACLPATSRSA